jgi:GntR family transcriptional regulator/MocR family aminotransferase
MAIIETNPGVELLLEVRRGTGAPPLGRQVEQGLREAIRSGRLVAGTRLPASRTLAADLGVARRVVVEAFEQLTAEGWLEARVGSGTFVRRVLPRVGPAGPGAGAGPRGSSRAAQIDFFPGHPDLAMFPRQAWLRAEREALRRLPDRAFGYGNPAGLHALREALAAYLGRVRGVVCGAHQVVVCQGAVQALGLIVRAHAANGRAPRVALEDPYLPEHRDALNHAGAEVVPVPIDELGVRDEAIRAARPAVAIVTPAHQFPTGVVLAAGRRAGLADWARRSGGLILEDDYDAEYRYDRQPVAALQALAPDRVAYLGSASKTLAPALRLAWLVVPEERLAAIEAAKRYADAGSPVLGQATLATLLTSGTYERHVRAARRRQRVRRDAVRVAVATYLPEARIGGIDAGLHAIVHLDRPVNAAALRAAALARGVRVYPLSEFRADPPPETVAVVLGYGGLHEAAIAAGIERFADALAVVR